MPQQTFEVTGPNGRVFEITGDRMPTEAELTDIFAKLPPKHAAKPVVPEQTLGRAIGTMASDLNPLPMVAALDAPGANIYEEALLRGAGAPPGMGNVIRGAGEAMAEQRQKGGEAYDKGNYVEAGLRKLAGVVPVLGPIAAGITDDIASGDYAGAAGHIGALGVPLKLPRGIKAATAAKLPVRVAQSLERGAARRVADVMAPKGSSKEIRRLNNKAAKIAPEVLNEPGSLVGSRANLKAKFDEKLQDVRGEYDDLEASRNPDEIFDTSPTVAGLESKLREIEAESAVGPEAHAQVERMGLNPIPDHPPSSAGKFDDLPVAYKQELRRIQAELDFIEHTPGGKISTEGEVAREGGYGSGRGARVKSAATSKKDYRQAEPGAEVYHPILAGKTGTTRAAMEKSLRRYIAGTQRSTPIVDRAIKEADRRLRDPDSASRPMLPKEAGFAEVDVAGPIGQNVTPEPSIPRAMVLRKVLQEVKDLGPAASRKAILKIRQSWDDVANTVYNPIVQDIDTKMIRARGAADATGVLRETLNAMDERAIPVNARFAFLKSAVDIMKAADEFERAKPRVGRKMMTQVATTTTGGALGGWFGGAIGAILGPSLDGVLASGVTTKIATAKIMNEMAKALRKGDQGAALSSLRKLAAVTKQTAKLNAMLYPSRQESE